MASLRCLHISFFFFFAVLVVVSFAAHTDDEVQNACGQTTHPDVCMRCIKSEPSRGSSEVPELTYEILFCMMSEATHGHEIADLSAQQTTEPNLKQALQTCNVSLFSASSELTDSLMRMEGKNYKEAEADLESANGGVLQCIKVFLKQPPVKMPPQLWSHVNLAGLYYDVARDFFHLIPK